MKMYFKTRSSARSIKSGKLTDNGQNAELRWSRDISKTDPLPGYVVNGPRPYVMQGVFWHDQRNTKCIPVTIKKSKI